MGSTGELGPKLVIVMVGLPARGKSFIAEKLARYLNWLQNAAGSCKSPKTPGDKPDWKTCVTQDPVENGVLEKELKHPASFFDPNNSKALRQREEVALSTLDQLLDWLLEGNGCAAIFDATNSTVERREAITHRLRQEGGSGIEILFLESCCDDTDMIEKNAHLKLSGPDYKGQDPKRALMDFRQRIQEYEKSYVPLGGFEGSQNIPYLKLINVGSKIIAYGIHGLLSGRVVEYLLNFHVFQRRIWITRNGESLDDVEGKIGRNSALSPKGKKFAGALASLVEGQRTRSMCNGQLATPSPASRSGEAHDDIHKNRQLSSNIRQPSSEIRTDARCRVWTSMMTQAIQTSETFDQEQCEIRSLKELDDLNAGRMAGLTFAEIEQEYPEEMAQRRERPLRYRWPGLGGEGYVDAINRLRSMVIELERLREDIVLITHSPVARVLLAYFQNMGRENLAEIQVPLGTVYAVTPQPYGVIVEKYVYDAQADRFDQHK